MADLHNIFITLFILLPRVMGALAVAPFFGSSSPAGSQRRAFLVASILVLVPVFLPSAPRDSLAPIFMGVLVLKELIIGFLFGFASGVGFWAMQAAGEYIDLQRGATAGAFFNPFLGGMSSPMGDFMLRFSIMLFFSVGGFTIFFAALLASYEFYPPWQLIPPLKIATAGPLLGLAGKLFELSLLYAAPLLILFLLIDLGLGFMSRFVPSLNVFFFSFPVKSVVGTFFLVVYLTFLGWAFLRNLFKSDTLLSWVRSILS
ncbi:MAG: EscT/YscT/HrcT family type III secretion system export apparatus protein [Verrucomicrobia bacterium]|nr:MAG: EscT/YscT/HrcT family type III secretion system export apparatus protein [Verrucomicrobiota bacterium]